LAPVWLGADARLPDVCLACPKPGYVVWFVRGILSVPIGDAETLRQVRAALAKLTKAAPGGTVTYTKAVTTIVTTSAAVLRDYSLSIRGSASLTTPAGTFDTILLEENSTDSEKQLDSGHSNVFTTDYWFDPSTGLLLKARYYKTDGTYVEFTTTNLEKVMAS
jgi:outer membrane lipoprotein-sorting protein